MLGLKHNLNLLVDYDPDWPLAFFEEKMKISEMCIERYGSTAVPGMRAKPILDILVGVNPIDDWKKCRAPLEGLGYDYAENAGVPGHYIFGRGRDLDVAEIARSARISCMWSNTLESHGGLASNFEPHSMTIWNCERGTPKRKSALLAPRQWGAPLKGPFLSAVKAALK
jgi:GrpB-like predicted nucleotidyltransferase (UPF0157 family)